MKDYFISVFYSEEDECYIADIPDFLMCSAHGDTPEEALREVLIAKQAIIDSMQENGMPVPEPKYRPAIYQIRGSSVA
jgi:predicted RNase H-like HicB family nuclease